MTVMDKVLGINGSRILIAKLRHWHFNTYTADVLQRLDSVMRL